MREGIYQETYFFDGKKQMTSFYVALLECEGETVAFHLEGKGNSYSPRANWGPRSLPIPLSKITDDDLFRKRVIHSCISLELKTTDESLLETCRSEAPQVVRRKKILQTC